VVMVPLLTSSQIKATQHLAHAASLVAVLATGVVGSVSYFRGGQLDWAAAIILALSAVIPAKYGALMARRASASLLRSILGLFMIVGGLLVPYSRLHDDASAASKQSSPQPSVSVPSPSIESRLTNIPATLWTLYVGAGATAGVMAGMLGIGGGTLMTPLLAILSPMSHQTVLGTCLLSMLPAAFTGCITHYRTGTLTRVALTRLAFPLALGAAIGSACGSQAALLASDQQLRSAFGVILIPLGARMLWTARLAR